MPTLELVNEFWESCCRFQAIIDVLSCHLFSLSAGDVHLNSDMGTAQFNSPNVCRALYSSFGYCVGPLGTQMPLTCPWTRVRWKRSAVQTNNVNLGKYQRPIWCYNSVYEAMCNKANSGMLLEDPDESKNYLVLSHLMLTVTWWGRRYCYYPHLVDGETEAQRS